MANWSKRGLGSTKFRILASFAILSILLVISVAVAHGLRTRGRSKIKKDALVARIENSPTFPIKIQQDDDTPLRIVEAKVREISPADYEELTAEK